MSRTAWMGIIALTAIASIVLFASWGEQSATQSGVSQLASAPEGRASERSLTQPSVKQASQTTAVVNRSDSAHLPSDAKTKLSLLRESADLRVFVEAMKRSSELGAMLYAMAATMECSTLRESWLQDDVVARKKIELKDGSSEASARRLGDLEWLQRRCAGFSSHELSLSEDQFLRQWARGKDALAALNSSLFEKAESRAEVQSRLNAVLASGDPLLEQRWLPSLASTAVAGQELPVSYLDGVPFGGLDQVGYWQAWRLALCARRGDCEMPNSELAMQCAFEGQCYASERAAVEAAALSTNTLPRVREVALRLEQVLATKQVSALLPP
ncbi:hypothetical protein [Piscinibacter sp.]|uniref:hypothetical protein n=1 Tax=Piscinibacter sp. TaxID=1903157 RepID=UPI0039E5063F